MISVIMPVYNVESYVARAIDSVLAQTYKDFELIIIDDGSSDKSPEIIDAYCEKDNRVKVFHTENRGVSSARNSGLEKMKGEYFYFVDGDDFIAEDCLSTAYSLICESGADCVKVNCQHVDEESNLIQENESKLEGTVSLQEKTTDFSDKYTFSTVWGKLYKTSKNIVPFKEDICYGEDYLFVIENLIGKNMLLVSPKRLHYNMIRNGSAIHSEYSYRRFTELKAFKHIEALIKPYKDAFKKMRILSAPRVLTHSVLVIKQDINLSGEDKKLLRFMLKSHFFAMLKSDSGIRLKVIYGTALFFPDLFRIYIIRQKKNDGV